MKKNNLMLVLLFLAVAGCGSTPTALEPITIIPGTLVCTDDMQTLRIPESVRSVAVNRYVDPNNNTMYEGGEAYVIQQSAAWNTRPNTPLKQQLGRQLTFTEPITADMQLQVSELQQTNQSLKEFGELLKQARADLVSSTKATQAAVSEIVKQNDGIKAKLDRTEKEMATLKRKLSDIEAAK